MKEQTRQVRGTRETEAIITEFRKKDGSIDEDRVSAALSQKPNKPGFPLFIFLVALIVDFIDLICALTIVADATVVGIPLNIAAEIVAEIISWIGLFVIWLWTLTKPYDWLNLPFGLSLKKALIRRVWRRFIATAIEKSIPEVNAIPMETVLVLWTHFDEVAVYKRYMRALNTLEKEVKKRHAQQMRNRQQDAENRVDGITRQQKNNVVDINRNRRVRSGERRFGRDFEDADGVAA
ncbi:MAG: hypothetical protein JO026_02915 [Patescibacteria group bacterium]|nr:hypothetical protein [Patescibacteria group bacterium]